MRKILALTSLLLMLYKPLYSQVSFDHITVAGGLSQSTVLSICKDSRGFMWFGTRDRLNRYDARDIRIYTHSYRDTGSISGNDYVFSVFEDREKNLWVGTVKGLNRYIPETDSFEHILHDPSNPASLSDNNVHSIFQDRSGRIWVGTNNGLNMLPSAHARKFVHYFKPAMGAGGLAGNAVHAIYQDQLGNLWIGTASGLTRMTYQNGRFAFKSFIHSDADPGSLGANSVQALAEDHHHNLWIGTDNGGLDLFNPQNDTFTHFKHNPANPNSLSSDDVRKIMPDNQGNLWIGTIRGLNIFNPDTKTFTRYEHNAEDRNSLSDNSIKEIYQDDLGTIWVGTTYGGVNVYHQNNAPFRVYQSNQYKNSISGNVVSAIAGGSKNDLWIGTEGSGLNRLNRQSGLFKVYSNIPGNKNSLPSNFIKAVYFDHEHNLWIGTHQGGLALYRPASDSFKQFAHDAASKFSVSSNSVSCLLEDSQNRFWVGTSNGLNLLDKHKQQFRNYIADPSKPIRLSDNAIRYIFEDSKRNIWVGTTIGLNLLRTNADAFVSFPVNERSDKTLHVGYVNCIKEDGSGTIWIGSFHGGLSRFDAQTQTFETFTKAQGLPSDNILNIQQANDGMLWLSTDNGLAQFDPLNHKTKIFLAEDGLPTNEFNASSSFKDTAGNLYFGSYNGLVVFNPARIKENRYTAPVMITGLKLFNQPVLVGDRSGLLKQDISLTKQVTFRYNQNVFSLDFTSLNYTNPGKNRYMYRLIGFEKNWNYTQFPTATYTNLPAGDYDFEVKGSNNDGIWNPDIKRLHIVVLPPLWKTWWAYLIYAISFFSLLALVVGFFRRQARLEADLHYEQASHEREHQLNQQKLDFFTQVSHEIRTPLTLIQAPLDKLLDEHHLDEPADRQIRLIKKNTSRLVGLVDELLDFRKIEDGKQKLQVAEVDLVAFVRGIFESFVPLSASKNIDYRFDALPDALPVFIDPNQFEKVVYNLLSNAFKFTPDGGRVSVEIINNENTIRLNITDNGPGIPEDVLPKLFAHFYQPKSTTTPGWGIGLALSKGIVELHGGRISVESHIANGIGPGGSTFTVELLKGPAHFYAEQFRNDQPLITPIVIDEPEIAELPLIDITEQNGKPLILLVEDNDDVRGFIAEALQAQYQVVQTVDGREGFETAVKIVPDLIISDVAMPVMDGFELSRKIKSDIATSHIPFIMLTAKATHEQMVSGLETGADDYITKPFSLKVLQLKVKNLLAARQAMRARYSQQVTLMPAGREISSPEEKFLERLMQLVELNLDDPEFAVAKLVDQIGMSQTALYRKVKALTGMTITDFIKSVRMKQAAALLAQNKLSIAEVAYTVGFSDRKYFSKEFKKQFGRSPSEFAAQLQDLPGLHE